MGAPREIPDIVLVVVADLLGLLNAAIVVARPRGCPVSEN